MRALNPLCPTTKILLIKSPVSPNENESAENNIPATMEENIPSDQFHDLCTEPVVPEIQLYAAASPQEKSAYLEHQQQQIRDRAEEILTISNSQSLFPSQQLHPPHLTSTPVTSGAKSGMPMTFSPIIRPPEKSESNISDEDAILPKGIFDEEIHDEAEENHTNNSTPEQCERASTDQQRPEELIEFSGVNNCSFKSIPVPLADRVPIGDTKDDIDPGLRKFSMVPRDDNPSIQTGIPRPTVEAKTAADFSGVPEEEERTVNYPDKISQSSSRTQQKFFKYFRKFRQKFIRPFKSE